MKFKDLMTGLLSDVEHALAHWKHESALSDAELHKVQTDLPGSPTALQASSQTRMTPKRIRLTIPIKAKERGDAVEVSLSAWRKRSRLEIEWRSEAGSEITARIVNHSDDLTTSEVKVGGSKSD